MGRLIMTSVAFALFFAASTQGQKGCIVSGEVVIEAEGDIHLNLLTLETWTNLMNTEENASPPFFQSIRLTPKLKKAGRVPFCFNHVPKGSYCSLGYQDVNKNGKLDFGNVRNPLEPSGYYKFPVTWTTWSTISFDVNKDLKGIEFTIFPHHEIHR